MSTKFRALFKIFVTGAVGALLCVGSAVAAPIISFDDDVVSQNGIISYDGVGGAAIGTGIDFVSVVGIDTPLNNGVALTCTGCVLNFTTGLNISEGPNLWTFAGGGAFTVTGTLFNGAIQIATGTLVSGAFGSADFNSFGLGSFSGTGIDEKHEDLLAFYGVGSIPFTFNHTDITAKGVNVSANGGFTAFVSNADLDNVAVPEPGTMLLFSTALLGLGLLRRRFKA